MFLFGLFIGLCAGLFFASRRHLMDRQFIAYLYGEWRRADIQLRKLKNEMITSDIPADTDQSR